MSKMTFNQLVILFFEYKQINRIIITLRYIGKDYEYSITTKYVNNPDHCSDCIIDFQQIEIADHDWSIYNRNRIGPCNQRYNNDFLTFRAGSHISTVHYRT